MTRYVGNAFSPSMIEGDAIVEIKEISKEEFIENGFSSKSIVGHPEIAEHFNLKLNRESIILNKGDFLYIVMPKQRPMANKMVENGAKYEFIPEDEGYVYKMIRIL